MTINQADVIYKSYMRIIKDWSWEHLANSQVVYQKQHAYAKSSKIANINARESPTISRLDSVQIGDSEEETTYISAKLKMDE